MRHKFSIPAVFGLILVCMSAAFADAASRSVRQQITVTILPRSQLTLDSTSLSGAPANAEANVSGQSPATLTISITNTGAADGPATVNAVGSGGSVLSVAPASVQNSGCRQCDQTGAVYILVSP